MLSVNSSPPSFQGSPNIIVSPRQDEPFKVMYIHSSSGSKKSVQPKKKKFVIEEELLEDIPRHKGIKILCI